MDPFHVLEDVCRQTVIDEDTEEKNVLVADSSGREEKESGYEMVARMLEARQGRGEIKWRLWQ